MFEPNWRIDFGLNHTFKQLLQMTTTTTALCMRVPVPTFTTTMDPMQRLDMDSGVSTVPSTRCAARVWMKTMYKLSAPIWVHSMAM